MLASGQTTELATGWRLQDDNKLGGVLGQAISKNGYDASNWLPIAKMPSTVLATLVENGVYKDVFFGKNLDGIPKLDDRSWWYRTSFVAPVRASGSTRTWLVLKGVMTCANVWVNGKRIAVRADIRGLHNKFQLDLTDVVQPGQTTTVALQIAIGASNFQPFNWIDWNPAPPDSNLGVWQPVYLKTTGNVEVRDPYVTTKLPLPATDHADLTVSADVVNDTTSIRQGTLKGDVAGLPFTQSVTLQPGERKTVKLNPIRLNHPRLWWPNGFGDPNLYPLNVRFDEGTVTSDAGTIQFGVRQFESVLSPEIHGYRWFDLKVNGKDVLVRGGAYRPDMLLRQDPARDESEVRYWKDMGWNAVRFEGTMGDERIYDLCDRYGILMEPGWPCCSKWEDLDPWSDDKLAEAGQMMDATARSLRAHASSAVYFLGSDLLINQKPLAMYHQILSNLRWTADKVTVDEASFARSFGNDPYVEGKYASGIHMRGPYDISTPMTWWQDPYEGAVGSCAEHSVGGCIPALETVRKFLPEGSIWPLDGNDPNVDYHTNFYNLNLTRDYISERYGPSDTAERFYDVKAQLNNYEAVRAQFEAFGAKRFTEAFHSIYWMGDNAWPGFKWQLYDYELKPTAGYFGFKKATQPLAIVYDLNSHDVIVANSTLQAFNGLAAEATLYNIGSDGTVVQQGATTIQKDINMGENTHVTAFNLSLTPTALSKTYFIRLKLRDAGGLVVADNLYWYSTQIDVNGTNHDDFGRLHYVQNADLTGLDALRVNPKVNISARARALNGQETATVKLTNNSGTNIAFFMRLEVTKGADGGEVLPALYSDNYVSLWPGESKTITATYANASLSGQSAWVRLKGQNVDLKTKAIVGP
ncbi:carbohydrate-binding protein [soil metagenome]